MKKTKVILLFILIILFSQCKSISYKKYIQKAESIPLVIIPGFGNYKSLLFKLQINCIKLYEKKGYGKVYIFDYRYPSNDTANIIAPINAHINVMQSRLYSFLKQKNLLNKKINIIGYSSGAVIGLSSVVKYYNDKNPIVLNKYISIAGPFDGIFFDQEYLIPENFLLIHDLYQYSNFMENEFSMENNPVLKSLLEDKNKSNLLNITHEKDVVSQKWSTDKFQNYMTNYSYNNIPGLINKFDTRKIVSEFLTDFKIFKENNNSNNDLFFKNFFNELNNFNHESINNRNKLIDKSQPEIYKYLFTQEHLSLPANPDVIKLIINFLTEK